MANMIPPRSEPHRIFGITLRRMRDRTGETQFVIAARAEVQKKSYAEYEMGLKAPKDLDRVHRLCDVLDATPDERTALLEVWGSIGSNNRVVHRTAVIARMESDIPLIPAVDPELRQLQSIIDAMRRSDRDDAPFMWAGVLDCVKRIASQGERWMKQANA